MSLPVIVLVALVALVVALMETEVANAEDTAHSCPVGIVRDCDDDDARYSSPGQGVARAAEIGLEASVRALDDAKRAKFFAFRFDVTTGSDVKGIDASRFAHVLKRKADELHCFGWVQVQRETQEQRSPSLLLAGEVRCRRLAGVAYLSWLQSRLSPDAINIKIYADTKIKLHFTKFEVLPEPSSATDISDSISRPSTCFRDAPHKCKSPEDLAAQHKSPDIIWLNKAL